MDSQSVIYSFYISNEYTALIKLASPLLVGAVCRDQLALSRAILLCGVGSQQAVPTRSEEVSVIHAVYSFDI